MTTLIVYSTKYGCTEKCAKTLAEKLSGTTEMLNLRVGNVSDLTQYDKVVIGGSIYAGKIQKEVSDFCSHNLNVLKRKRIGLFICGMLQEQAEPELHNSYPPELLAHAVAKEFFGGELKFKQLNFVERLAVKMVSKADKIVPLDTTKDISAISDVNIDRFAQLMNNV